MHIEAALLLATVLVATLLVAVGPGGEQPRYFFSLVPTLSRPYRDLIPNKMDPQPALNRVLFALRVLVAASFLLHGVPKAIDIGFAVDKFMGYGLPGFLGPVIGWIEVVAAMALLIGWRHRLMSAILGVILIGALVTVQLPAGIQAGLERDLLLLVSCALFLFSAPGSYSLRGSH